MLSNQDFAQSSAKSPVKRRLELVDNANQGTGESNSSSDLNRAVIPPQVN